MKRCRNSFDFDLHGISLFFLSLDYAKLESGSFEVDTSKMSSLQATVESIAFSIAPKLDEKNCTLRTFFAADLPQTLRTDSRRLQQGKVFSTTFLLTVILIQDLLLTQFPHCYSPIQPTRKRRKI